MSNFSTIGTQSIFESLAKSWLAVKTNVWLFAGFIFLYFVASSVITLVPWVGDASSLFSFILTASLFSSFFIYDQKKGEIEFSDFFKWSPRFGRLFLGNLVLIILTILLVVPFILLLVGIVGIDFFVNMAYNADLIREDPDAFVRTIDLGTVLMILGLFFLFVIALSLSFFAFSFIIQFTDLSIGATISYSLKIGRNNIGQMVLYAFVALGLFIIGLIPCGLGLLITLPLIFGTQYYFLKDMIAAKEEDITQVDFNAQI